MSLLALETAVIGGAAGAAVLVIAIILFLVMKKGKGAQEAAEPWTPPASAQPAAPTPQAFGQQPAPTPQAFGQQPAPQGFGAQPAPTGQNAFPAPAPAPAPAPQGPAVLNESAGAAEESVVETAAQSTTVNPDEIVRGKTMAMGAIDFEAMLAERNKKK